MSNGEIIISVVTAVLVVFSLVVSVVIPKRDPRFPGRRNIAAFGVICAVLIGGTLAAVEVYGAEEGHGAEAVLEGEHGGEAEGEAEEPPTGEAPARIRASGRGPAARRDAGRSGFGQRRVRERGVRRLPHACRCRRNRGR